MRYKPLVAAVCLLLLLLYFSLYYYEVIEAPQWVVLSSDEVETSTSPPPPISYSYVDIYPFNTPHMRKAKESHFLPPIPCGSGWQEEYGEFHRKTLKEDGKVLVSVAVEGGIADNLSGLMSEFYLALLSKRALQIYEYGYLPKYEPAFEHAYFNWSNPGTYPDMLTNNLKYTFHGERGWLGDRMYGPEVNTTENWPIYQMNDYYNEKDKMFGEMNLASQVPANHTEVKRVFMMSNRGMTYRLGHNVNHNETFSKIGLRPELMFGCAFRAIFRPTEALVRRNGNLLNILTDPGITKIGIMVRTGDDSFSASRISDERFNSYMPFFECAEQIEGMIARTNSTKPIIWYLLSDSLDFRRKAKVKFGAKVVTDVETNFIHPDCAAHDVAQCSFELTEIAMMQAAGQVISFAWTDYQVISRYSGFGRIGAVLGGDGSYIYSMPRDDWGPCTETHSDPWEQTANVWAGI